MTEAVLTAESLVRQYGGVRAVNGVSFSLRKGEILGLIGPNGAGKTTTFNLLSGFAVPQVGTVTFEGNDITKWSPSRRAQRGLVRTFQQARCFAALSVRDNIRIAVDALSTHSRREQLGGEDEGSLIDEHLDQFGLLAFRNARAGDLSYGQLKRLGVVTAACTRPTVLLLDEPAAGLNGAEVRQLRSDLEHLRGTLGISVCLVEHNMGLVMSVSDRLVVLDAGELLAEGTPSEISQNDEVIRAYLGGDK